MSADIPTWDNGLITVGNWEEDGTFELRVRPGVTGGNLSVWLGLDAAERLLVEVADRVREAENARNGIDPRSKE